MPEDQNDAGHPETPSSLEEALESETSEGLDENSAAPALADEGEPRETDEAEGTQPDSLTGSDGESEQETPDELHSDDASGQTPEDAERWKRRYSGLQSKYDQDRNAYQRERDEFQARLAQMEQEIAKRSQVEEERSLPAFDPRSPRNQEFQQTYNNYQLFRRQLAQVDPESREAVAGAWSGILSEEDVRQCQQYDQTLAEQNRRFHADPIGTMREQLRAEVGNALAEYNRNAQMQQHYNGLVEKYADTVEKHRDQIAELVQKGYDLDQILPKLQMEDELSALKTRLASTEVERAQAQEQRRLAQGEVSDAGNRDVTPANSGQMTADQIYAEAKAEAEKRGIDSVANPNAFIQILNATEAKYGI